MQDDHWMRGWNSGHEQFSADLDKGAAKLIGFIAQLRRRRNERDTRLRGRIGLG